MSQLADARANEITGSLVDQIGNGTITDTRDADALLGAVNAEIVMDLNGKAVALFDLRTGAASLTLVFEGSVDGTNYTVSLPGFNLATETMLASVIITSTQATIYAVGVSGLRRIRCRVSAYTSGNVTVTARATSSDLAIYSRPMPSTLHVTVTAAANTAATITLPAAGAGLFHYITALHICRNATAALAGTATLVITSTNLPGSMAWSVGNAMAAGGTQRDVDYSPTTPLKSSVANTASTVVMPAPGAAVLWRGNCTYYVGA